jgi:ketosteroid isomerase-like protein
MPAIGVSQQEAIETVKKGYAAFQDADLDAIRAISTDDLVWHAVGRNPVSGTFRGIDNVLASFARLAMETEGTFAVELHDVLASDDHVVALATATGKRKGRTLKSDYAHICHMRDGKLAEAWIVDTDPYAGDEFWAD